MYDISGKEPVLGTLPHEQVQDAIASGKYSFPHGEDIPVVSPDGEYGTVPAVQARAALNNGYTYATPRMLSDQQEQKDYGSAGQQALTIAEGAAKGVAGPVATGAEALLTGFGVPGLSPEEQEKRAKVNPWESGVFEAAGLIVPAIASGGLSAAARAGLEIPEAIGAGAKALAKYSQAGVLSEVGAGAASRLIPKGAGAISKIGSAAVAGAVENLTFMAGDIGSKIINGTDPQSAVESALPYVGMTALIGGGLGAGLGTAGALWHATYGSDLGGVLHAISNKVGGREGVVSDAITQAMEKVGIQPKPEIVASMASDPEIQKMAKVLEQTDTTGSGIEYQKALADFHEQAKTAVANNLGTTTEELAAREKISTHEAGKSIGDTLADEAKERVQPLKEGYDQRAEQFQGKDLSPSIAEKSESAQKEIAQLQKQLEASTAQAERAQKAGDPGKSMESALKVEDLNASLRDAEARAKIPGTKDVITDQLSALSNKERWDLSPSSEINKAVESIKKELSNPKLATLSDLTKYIKSIDQKLPYDPFNGERNRAAGMIKKIFRESESAAIGQHIGSEEGEAALEKYQADRAGYAKESDLKEQLADRLGKLGSTSNYPAMIKQKAGESGEKFLSRISGKNDAGLLDLLKQNFPKTYEALKNYHLNNLVQNSMSKGEFSIKAMQKAVGAMSPELKAAIVPGELSNKLEAMKVLQDQLEKQPHNHSNTARVSAALAQNGLSSAMGLLSYLTGHGAAASVIVGQVSKYLSKNAPDAVRLGLLKFLGSNKPIEAGAFKAMVNLIHSAANGDKLIKGATDALFSGASKVIPAHLEPSHDDLVKLDEKAKKMAENPSQMMNVAGSMGHYLPDHAGFVAQTAMNAITQINAGRPHNPKMSPLDSDIPVSKAQNAPFYRSIAIAQQPLMAIQHVKNGTLLPQDVATVKTIYPTLYNKLSQEMMASMTDHLSSGGSIPYKVRQSMSIFMGQELDSTMTPGSIQAIQATYAQSAPQPQGAGGGKPKGNTSKLGDMAKGMMTPDQSRQSHRERA